MAKMKLFNSKIRKFFLTSFLAIISFTCSNEKYPLPNVAVNISISPAELAVIGIGSTAYCPISGGIKGIIIYRDSEDSYFAYERECPYYPTDDCAIEIETGNILQAKCPCCGSEYSLWTGDVLKGPSRWYLKQYKAYLSGGRLYITN